MKNAKLLIIITCFPGILYAQNFSGGITGGINFSKHNEEHFHSEFNIKKGIIAGFVVTYYLSDYFSLNSSILFEQKGNVRTFPEYNTGQEKIPSSRVVNRMNYLEFPILLALNITTSSEVKPKVFIGASYSYLLNATAEAIYGIKNHGKEIDQTRFWNSDEICAVFGAGADILINKIILSFDASYKQGLIDINNGIGGGKITSEAFAITAGYKFLF